MTTNKFELFLLKEKYRFNKYYDMTIDEMSDFDDFINEVVKRAKKEAQHD